jgi:hypothetical protein
MLITHGEGTEVQGVDWQHMQQPWLWWICSRSLSRQDSRERGFVFRAELPYPQGVITAMAAVYKSGLAWAIAKGKIRRARDVTLTLGSCRVPMLPWPRRCPHEPSRRPVHAWSRPSSMRPSRRRRQSGGACCGAQSARSVCGKRGLAGRSWGEGQGGAGIGGPGPLIDGGFDDGMVVFLRAEGRRLEGGQSGTRGDRGCGGRLSDMGKRWLSVHVSPCQSMSVMARGRVAVPLHGRVRSTTTESLFWRRRTLTTDDRLDCSGMHAGIVMLVLVLVLVLSQCLASSTVLPASASAALLFSWSYYVHPRHAHAHAHAHVHAQHTHT